MSLNREATRVVDRLRDPGQTPVGLLNLVTFRQADGREVPIAGLLSAGERVYAKEIVTGPDGRSVTALLNATPIIGEDGAVESVVVAMQDMAAVEEKDLPGKRTLLYPRFKPRLYRTPLTWGQP